MPPPLRVKYLNHAAIEARDIDTVCAFYETILGFRRLPRPALGFPGCWLEMPGVMLHITEVDPTVPRRVENWKDLYEGDPEAWYIRRATHLAFEVEDFDEAEDRLRQHGMEYTRFVLPEVNMRQLFLYDPEGHGIEMGVYDDSRHFIKEHGDTMPSYTPSRPTDGLTD